MFLLYLSPLIGSLVGYRNSRLALIFLQNFESIASLLSRIFYCEVPYASDSWSFKYSQSSYFCVFCFVLFFCLFFWKLVKLFCSQCSAVSLQRVLTGACFIESDTYLVHSFLLEIRAPQFGMFPYTTGSVNSFFFLFSLFLKLLLRFWMSSLIFYSLFSFLSFFTVSSGICPQFSP